MILIEFKGDDLAMLRAALACAASDTDAREYLCPLVAHHAGTCLRD